MALTPAQLAEAEAERVRTLSRQSELEDVALIEIVYRGRYARFDVSSTQAYGLTAAQLVERCFVPAFEAVRLKTHIAAEATDQAESSALSASVT